MTEAQRKSYWSWRWPDACRAQGWDRLPARAREERRRNITLKASTAVKGKGAFPTDSITALNNDQVTALFAMLKHPAHPEDLAAAVAVANPAETQAEDRRGRVLWKVRELAKRAGYNDAYIQEIAAWDCREAQVAHWHDLPEESLQRVLIHLDNRRAGRKSRPASTDGQTIYQMRPARKFVPKATATAVVEDDNCSY